MDELVNSKLKETDIPAPQAEWKIISQFAHTFDAYKYYGSFETCEKMANDSFAAYQIDRSLPRSLTDLRACLFFEARRWEHLGGKPDQRSLDYVQALLEGIRRKLESKDIQ